MDLQKQPHISSSIGSLFMTQLLMNPNWKSLTGLTKDKLQTRLPMDGEGTNPNNIEERSISLSLFCGLFWSKFWWRDAFHFREGPVPTCQSTLHNLEGTSFLFLSLWLFFTFEEWVTSKIFEGSSCKQRVCLLTLLQFLTDCSRPCWSHDKRLKSRKGLLKIDLSLVLNCHPDLLW
jgi:hypothetical protein